ncbi:MAG: hypothetical protein HYY06_10835 [Deltaproteobacteria bacterium]|nr:hypothetical protein [Deltaproteobacteria bacterium]
MEPGLALALYVETDGVDDEELLLFSAETTSAQSVAVSQGRIEVNGDVGGFWGYPTGASAVIDLDIEIKTDLRLEARAGGAYCFVEFTAEPMLDCDAVALEIASPAVGQVLGPEDDTDGDPTDGVLHTDVVLSANAEAGYARVWSGLFPENGAEEVFFDSSPITVPVGLGPGSDSIDAFITNCERSIDVVVEIE